MGSLSKAETQDVWKLIRTAKVFPKKTGRQVMNEYDIHLASVDTIKYIFQEHERKGCIAAKKPLLTKKVRLSWSKMYELWDANA